MSPLASTRLSMARLGAALALGVAALASATASTVTHGFDGLGDLESLTTQIPGLTFNHALALVDGGLGGSLNELDFPPRSGAVVIIDDGAPIEIVLDSAATVIGAYFTYTTSITLTAFDAGNTLLGSSTSAFSTNLGTGGDPGSSANEWISFANLGGNISRVVITGLAAGGSFSMDDLTIERAATVPEPATAALVLSLLALGSLPGGWLRRRR